jgi:hypothetical protein
MPARWFADVDHPQCKALTLYIPRTKFVDFLLYVPRGTEEVYVIPRGLLEYNTTWSEPKLTTYRHAWHPLQVTSPELFGRRFAHLSPWLRRVISGLEARDIPYQLVRSEKGKQLTKGRIYLQRRLLVNGRRCAIYAPKYIERATAHSPVVISRLRPIPGRNSCCTCWMITPYDLPKAYDRRLGARSPSCYKFEMSKTIEQWLLFEYIGLEFTPLSKPFKAREQAEKAREKYPERLRKGIGVIRIKG